MLNEKPSEVLKSIGGTVTKRNSVMTPLLVLNFTIFAFSTLIYIFTKAWFPFVFLVITIPYTIYRYEKFSKIVPWMLSGEEVQKYGMQLTMGDSTKELTQQEIVDMTPVDNPQNNTGIDGGKIRS